MQATRTKVAGLAQFLVSRMYNKTSSSNSKTKDGVSRHNSNKDKDPAGVKTINSQETCLNKTIIIIIGDSFQTIKDNSLNKTMVDGATHVINHNSNNNNLFNLNKLCKVA